MTYSAVYHVFEDNLANGDLESPMEEIEDLSSDANILTITFDKRVRPYIDLVDNLRRHGLEQDIDLPSIVVIGDQSSGKSSIIEAISGIQLPRGSGIVTRCPLEMQLKKLPGMTWHASLRYETSNHLKMEKSVTDPGELERLIRTAQDEIAGAGKGISRSLITLNVTSANSPDLTLIDLPGITRCAVDGQPHDIPQQIKNLLRDYIEKENTIMLCVIPANVDLAANEALSVAQEVDKEGNRTLGVITKPDLVDPGAEGEVITILNNEKFYLKKGYSIVRCRGQREISEGTTLEEALEQEEEFFISHREFRQVDEEQRGTRQLAMKLTENLVEHIKRTLPFLREEIHHKLDETNRKLAFMDHGPPDEQAGKRVYLIELTTKLLQAVEKAVAKGDMLPTKAVIKDPKELKIYNSDMPDKLNTSYLWRVRFSTFQDGMGTVTKNAFKKESLTTSKLEKKLATNRGRELPHFINFDLFEDLVCDHIQRYDLLASECLEKTSKDLQTVMTHLCKEHLQHVPSVRSHIQGISEECREECLAKGKEMMSHEMEKEKLVFTQDQTYTIELKRLQERLMKKANERNSNKRKGVGLSFNLTGDEDDELENNAKVMRKLLKIYIQVANRRIQDNIPMVVRTTQHLSFYRLLSHRLRQLVGGDDVDRIVEEDPKIAIERKKLKEKAKRLSEAMKLLIYTS